MSLGAAKCMHVQEDVATRFMKIIQDSIDLSKRAHAENLPMGRAEGGPWQAEA